LNTDIKVLDLILMDLSTGAMILSLASIVPSMGVKVLGLGLAGSRNCH